MAIKDISHYWVKVITIASVYFLAARFGLSLAVLVPQASTIWPASGIALAALLIFGTDLWPAITIGAISVNLLAHEPVSGAIIIGLGNTLETVFAVYFLKKLNFHNSFDRVRDVVGFSIMTAIACGAGAFIGTTSLFISNLTTIATVGSAYATWWIGDVMGMFIIAPVIMTWATYETRNKFWRNRVEAITTIFFGGVLSLLLFIAPSNPVTHRLLFLIMPILLLAAFRLGATAVATMNLVVGAILTFATVENIGPFSGTGAVETNLIFSHLFLYVAAGMGLFLTSAIAERDAADNRIVANELRLRALTKHSSDGVVVIDRQAMITYVNLPTESVLGFKERDLLGRNLFDLVHLLDEPEARSKFTWVLMHPGEAITFQVRARHQRGHWVWIETTITNLLDESNVRGIVINYHDVTVRRQAEDKIMSYTKELELAVRRTQEEVAKEEALLASIGDGFIATDKEGNIIFVNPAAEKMLAWSAERVIGKPLQAVLEIVDEDSKVIPPQNRPIHSVLTTGKTFTTGVVGKAYSYVRSDGTKIPVAITVSPVILNGAIIGAEEVFKDITKDQQVDRAKSEFVSLASHQLRTPLAIVNWYTDALVRGKLGRMNRKQGSYLRQIYAANKRLVKTVNNLLDVSRLEMGTFPVKPMPIEMATVLKGIISSLSREIKKKRLSVTSSVEKKAMPVMLDRSLLVAILDNLVSNAVKYTGEGGTIRITLLRSRDTITILVADTGYGIPKSEHNKVFDRFYRGSNVVEKSTDGNGLGLYIVKRIVEFMGGTIDFTSEQNRGTTFSVAFPAKRVERHKGPRRPAVHRSKNML